MYYDSAFTHKAAECKIKKGKKEGHYYYWTEDGKSFFDIMYKRGKKHGLDISMHKDEDGKVHYFIQKYKENVMIKIVRED